MRAIRVDPVIDFENFIRKVVVLGTMEEYLQKAAQLVAVGLEKLEQIPVLKHVWFPTE